VAVALPLASVTGSITSAIGDWGLYAVFLLMVLDAVFPAASELVMLYAGAVAAGAIAGQTVTVFGAHVHTPAWAFVAMALAGTLGNTVGSVLGWGIGAYGGRPLLERRGRLFHLTPERLDRAERWFDRFGDAAVFLGRVTPVVRSFISIPAGIARMPLGRFTVLTFLGCVPWCFGLAGIGWAIGSRWHRFHDGFRYVDYAVVALALAAVLYLAWRVWAGRAARRAAGGSLPGE
jgi:membrane protein DedA with SNARE-associated domain